MESPSQAPHSGGSPWKGLLLTAFFLSCWIQPASAPNTFLPVVTNTPYGTVGSSVILDIQGTPVQPTSYTWFRNTVTPSNQIALYDASSGQPSTSDSRLNVFSNGSLLISNLTLSDTGVYLVQFINLSPPMIVTAEGNLQVYETASKPNITANRTNVMENSTVIFTCVTEHEGIDIRWPFNNESLSLNERKNLSENNQTLTIKNVTREDTGSYQCEVWNLVSANTSDPLNLTVSYGPDSIMFSPSPVRDEIEVILETSLILGCQAESYPPAQYGWRVNDTVNSNFSGNTYNISNVSWEDSGIYTCLAWNNITNITVSKDVTVRVVDGCEGEVRLVTLHSNQRHLQVLSSSPDVMVLFKNKGQTTCEKSELPEWGSSHLEESPEGRNGSSLSGEGIAGIVIGVLAGMALIGALIYFLFFRKPGGVYKEHLSKNPSAAKHGEDTTVYENTGFPKGSALFAHGLVSSPAFPEDPSKSAYQALDMSRVDVYEKIVPWKNPQA